MTIRLGIDASQQTTSCAVLVDKMIKKTATTDKPIENISALIKKTLSDADIELNDIDEIVACVGPGSNMGTRATVVTGNTLAYALHKPIVGVLSIDALAYYSSFQQVHNVAVPAGRGRWYVGRYCWNDNVLNRLSYPELVDLLPENLPCFCTSSFNEKDTPFICACGILRIAETQKHLTVQSYKNGVIPFDRGN